MTHTSTKQEQKECCIQNKCAEKKELNALYEGQDNDLSDLIPILQAVQQINGYLSKEALVDVSERTGIPLSHIYGVVTFYAAFYLEPRGKYTVKVCRGTACHVRGAPDVIRSVKGATGLAEGESDSDLKFTFETVACLGACALAPLVLVNQQYYGKVNAKKMDNIIKHYQQEG